MLEFALAMTIAIVCSVVGDVLTKQGTSRLKSVPPSNDPEGVSTFKPSVLMERARQTGIFHNWRLILGVFVLTLHFLGFIAAMRLAPVTLVVPLMSSTYVLTTIVGCVVLKEHVSRLRWAGILVIMLGVVLLGVSSLETKEEAPAVPTTAPTLPGIHTATPPTEK